MCLPERRADMESQKGNEKRAITIYDIAKEAGVSAATVSRVLTNSTNVRAEKREKVLRLVEKYNFKPNALAKGLADTKSKIIGILVADIRNPFYAELFISCEKAAKDAGYTVLLCNSFNELEQEVLLLEKLQEQRVDAIIQIGGRVDDLITDVSYAAKVNQIMTTVPVVVTGKLEGTRCRMVRIDASRAMDLLMEHLLGLGHQKIALVGGNLKVLSTFEKFVCYQETLKRNGIEFVPELVEENGTYTAQSGYELMTRVFARGVVPTAVIAINDFAAAGVMRCIQERGYRIPEDISLVSYDNTQMADLLIPRLTSIDYDYESFGKKLVETAIAAMNAETGEQLQTVTPHLVIRESSGKCKE